METYRIIGLDLGTHCGVSVWTGQGPRLEGAGTPLRGSLDAFEWDLAPHPGEGGGMRPLRFRRSLEALLVDGPPVVELGYEAVLFSRSAAASHVYGELRGVLMMVCEDRGVPYRAIPVSTAKRHATGNHMAKKHEVAQAMLVRFKPVAPGLAKRRAPLTENTTDSLSVLACLLDNVDSAPREGRRVTRPARARPAPGSRARASDGAA